MPKQNFDQAGLYSAVLEETTETLKYLKQEYGEKELYAFILNADNDVTSVYPTANTIRDWNKLCQDNRADIKHYENEASFSNFYKWYPEEWLISLPDEYQFNKTTNVIYPDNSTEESADFFLARKKLAIEVIDKALAAARDCVFESNTNLAVLLTINDAEEYERNLIIESASPYNNGSIITELRKLYKLI